MSRILRKKGRGISSFGRSVEVFFGIVQLLGDGFGVQDLVAQREGARLGEGVQVLQQGKQRKADRKLTRENKSPSHTALCR